MKEFLNLKFPLWSVLLGLAFLIFLAFFNNKGKICIPNSSLVQVFPDSLQKESDKVAYLVSSASFVTDADIALKSYSGNNRISKGLQDSITMRLFEPKAVNGSNLIDTVRGVNFDFETVVKSMMEGQKVNSIRKLKIPGYGIYIGFGYYPSIKPIRFKEMSDSLYNADFKNFRTAYLNYTNRKIEDGKLIYTLLKSQGLIEKVLEPIGDNIGMKCRPYCGN